MNTWWCWCSLTSATLPAPRRYAGGREPELLNALDFRKLIASNLLKPVLISLLNCIAGESRLGGVFDDVYYFLAERSAVTADQARGFSMLVFPLGLPLCFPQLLSPHAMRLPHETVETAVKLLDDVSLTHRHPAHRRRMTSR